ncbi:hypothetical protein Acr_20g0007310 [Actinidia rufa]|uniref:Uncharacterized protein n=1 Tax=Actinidia rufa TaxID=165716 RepID=A0A7J0GDP1_9ERIC|nr:hypothetical protein Acr_20g0007310 [Actinidia rufa]
MHMIKRGINIDTIEEEEEGEEETSHHAMKTGGYIEEVPPQTEETYEDPSAQNLQLQWQGKDPIQEEHPMHEGHSVHEGPSLQEGPPGWFLEYFEKLNATMEHAKKIKQNNLSR